MQKFQIFPHSALLLALLLMIIVAPGAQAQTTPQTTPQKTLQMHRSGGVNYHVETLVPGLTFPWSLALVDSAASGSGSAFVDSADSAPSAGGWVQNVTPREAFVSIRSGELLFVSNLPRPGAGGEARVRRVSGLPAVSAAGQGGLLDIVLSPHFARNFRLYFSTAFLDERALSGTAVYTAIFDRANMRLSNVRLIFSLEKTTQQFIHFGSRLVIDPEGNLFVSVGDRGDRERAQDRRDAAGGIVRIPLTAAGLPAGAPENYSYGHRNIQGMVYHPGAGRIMAHEHGPRGGDEINLIIPNANYGWPRVSYGINYDGSKVSNYQSLPGIVEPVVYWTPSIAPSGFAVYPETGVFARGGDVGGGEHGGRSDGDHGGGWSNQLFVGALAGRHLRRIELPENWENASGWPLKDRAEEEQMLSSVIGRVRDVRVDSAGYIYLLTDERAGALYRLIPAEQ